MYKKILQLAWPIIFANILQMVYQMTDLFWIGRYSTQWVAAVSLAGPIIFFFMSIGIGLTIAGTILVAQSWWAKRYETLNHIVSQSIVIATLFSIVVAILWYLIAPVAIGWMWAEAQVTAYATSYLQISFIGIISVFGYMTIQSLWRWMGEVKMPVYIVIVTALINMIIDPVLIMWWWPIPSFGVDGAAWATMITQTLAWIIALVVLYRRGNYYVVFERQYFRVKKEFIKQYLWLAIPSWIDMSARSLWMVLLAYIVAAYGTSVTAAYGVGNEIITIVIFIALGFSMAATTLAGQYYGAKKFDKIIQVKERSLTMSVWVLLVLGVIVFFFAPRLVNIFVPGETEVIQTSVHFLRIVAFFLWTYGIQFVITWMFRWLWEVKAPMIITLLALWGLQIPIAYFGARFYGADAIWWSLPIANVLATVIAWVWYESWKQKKLVGIQD